MYFFFFFVKMKTTYSHSFSLKNKEIGMYAYDVKQFLSKIIRAYVYYYLYIYQFFYSIHMVYAKAYIHKMKNEKVLGKFKLWIEIFLFLKVYEQVHTIVRNDQRIFIRMNFTFSSLTSNTLFPWVNGTYAIHQFSLYCAQQVVRCIIQKRYVMKN